MADFGNTHPFITVIIVFGCLIFFPWALTVVGCRFEDWCSNQTDIEDTYDENYSPPFDATDPNIKWTNWKRNKMLRKNRFR